MAKGERRTADPRILRTRSLLENALLESGESKPFATISVADITPQAGVSRSTFYDHFTDLEALLFQTLEEGVQIENDVDRFAAVPDSSDEPPSELVRFLRHVERNRALYRSALGEHGSTMFLHALRRRI